MPDNLIERFNRKWSAQLLYPAWYLNCLSHPKGTIQS